MSGSGKRLAWQSLIRGEDYELLFCARPQHRERILTLENSSRCRSNELARASRPDGESPCWTMRESHCQFAPAGMTISERQAALRDLQQWLADGYRAAINNSGTGSGKGSLVSAKPRAGSAIFPLKILVLPKLIITAHCARVSPRSFWGRAKNHAKSLRSSKRFSVTKIMCWSPG